MTDQTPSIENYTALLASIKERIQSAQVRAALAVNSELVLLYWGIGSEITRRQKEEGWGTKVIDNLARDLKRSFPDMQGFSLRNLKYMKSFAEAWPEEAIVQQAAALLPWFHNCVLLDKVKDPEERLWYIREAIQNGWSRNVLVIQIEAGLFRRQGKALTNFQRTLTGSAIRPCSAASQRSLQFRLLDSFSRCTRARSGTRASGAPSEFSS